MSKPDERNSAALPCSPDLRIAYRLGQGDLEHLLLGGEIVIRGQKVTLVLAVDGIPVRDCIAFRSDRMMVNCGPRVGCVRDQSFDAEDDGT